MYAVSNLPEIETPLHQHQQEVITMKKRTIFENVSYAISSIANMINSASSAVSRTAEACDVVADTGLVLATNVQETTIVSSTGKKRAKLDKLYQESKSPIYNKK